jgi:hypothetical protein
MNRYLLKILDILQILSIISAALLELPFFNKALLLVNLSISLYFITFKNKIYKKILMYIISVMSMFSLLMLIGLIKGNNLNDIFHFILPLFSLFNILVYFVLSKKYSLDRYLYIYYACSIAVAIKIILLFLLFDNQLFLEYIPLYDPDVSKASWVAHQRGLIRVYVDQALLIPMGVFLSFYFFKKIHTVVAIILFLSLLLTQTFSFIFCFILAITFSILVYYKKFAKILIFILVLSTLTLFAIFYSDLFIETHF